MHLYRRLTIFGLKETVLWISCGYLSGIVPLVGVFFDFGGTNVDISEGGGNSSVRAAGHLMKSILSVDTCPPVARLTIYVPEENPDMSARMS